LLPKPQNPTKLIINHLIALTAILGGRLKLIELGF